MPACIRQPSSLITAKANDQITTAHQDRESAEMTRDNNGFENDVYPITNSSRKRSYSAIHSKTTPSRRIFFNDGLH